jgi:hypothetical protein
MTSSPTPPPKNPARQQADHQYPPSQPCTAALVPRRPSVASPPRWVTGGQRPGRYRCCLRRDAREAAGDARVVVCVAVFRVELSHSGPLMPGKPSTLPAPATSSNGRARLRDKYTPPEHARSPVSSPEAKRKILAAVTARSHVYNDDDPWFSCPPGRRLGRPHARVGMRQRNPRERSV